MINILALQFDTPNNSCHSLRVLAELVRVGDVVITEATMAPHVVEPISAAIVVGFNVRNAK